LSTPPPAFFSSGRGARRQRRAIALVEQRAAEERLGGLAILKDMAGRRPETESRPQKE